MSFNFSDYVYIQLPEGQVQTISRKSDGVVIWKRRGINRVLQSTESDGRTIYNGGKGYKTEYRIRSGGAELENSNTLCTGFIPVRGSSVVRATGTWADSVVHAYFSINLSDASFNNLGQVVNNSGGYGILAPGAEYGRYASSSVVQRDGYIEWLVPPAASGAAYVRVTAPLIFEDGFTVTVDEDIV